MGPASAVAGVVQCDAIECEVDANVGVRENRVAEEAVGDAGARMRRNTDAIIAGNDVPARHRGATDRIVLRAGSQPNAIPTISDTCHGTGTVGADVVADNQIAAPQR